MDTLDLLDSYEEEYQPHNNRSLGKHRATTKKRKSCWRQIERIKEQRQLLREVQELHDYNGLDALEAAFL